MQFFQAVDKVNFVNGLFFINKMMYNKFVRQLIYSKFELTSLTFFVYFWYNIIGIYEKVSDYYGYDQTKF